MEIDRVGASKDGNHELAESTLPARFAADETRHATDAEVALEVHGQVMTYRERASRMSAQGSSVQRQAGPVSEQHDGRENVHGAKRVGTRLDRSRTSTNDSRGKVLDATGVRSQRQAVLEDKGLSETDLLVKYAGQEEGDVPLEFQDTAGTFEDDSAAVEARLEDLTWYYEDELLFAAALAEPYEFHATEDVTADDVDTELELEDAKILNDNGEPVEGVEGVDWYWSFRYGKVVNEETEGHQVSARSGGKMMVMDLNGQRSIRRKKGRGASDRSRKAVQAARARSHKE